MGKRLRHYIIYLGNCKRFDWLQVHLADIPDNMSKWILFDDNTETQIITNGRKWSVDEIMGKFKWVIGEGNYIIIKTRTSSIH